MNVLQLLTERIHRDIPLTRHIDFRYERFDGNQLVLSVPLAANKNDKQTMFAGSIVSLCTLGGWSLTTLLAEQLVPQVDVLAVRGDIRYKLPTLDDAQIIVTADADKLAHMAKSFAAKQRAKMSVVAELVASNGVCAVFEGDYLARMG